jgi:hypothetical protein
MGAPLFEVVATWDGRSKRLKAVLNLLCSNFRYNSIAEVESVMAGFGHFLVLLQGKLCPIIGIYHSKLQNYTVITYLIGNKILIFLHASFLLSKLCAKNHIHIPC